MILWLLWNVFQVFRRPYDVSSLVTLGRLAGYLFTAFLIALFFNEERDWKRFIRVISYAAGICSLYVILEYFGLDIVKWASLKRPPGTFSNPNFTADFLASVFPFILMSENRRFFVKKQVKPLQYRGFGIGEKRIPFMTVLVLAAVLMTQSRAGMIGLAFALFTLFSLLYLKLSRKRISPVSRRNSSPAFKNHSLRIVRIFLIAILLIEIFVAPIFWFFPEKLDHVLNSTTVQLRLNLWEGSVKLFLERPLMGWGAGSFETVAYKIIYLAEPIVGKKHARHAHSWFLELIVEHGIIGVILFLTLLGSLITIFLKKIMDDRNHLDHAHALIAGTAGIFSLLAATLFGVWLNWWGGGWILWILIGIGMAISLSGVTKNKSESTYSDLTETKVSRKGFACKFAALFLVILSPVIIYVSVQIMRSEHLLWKATRAGRNAGYVESLDMLERAGEIFPYSPEIRFRKAVTRNLLGESERARQTLAPLLKKSPGNPKYKILMGQILAGNGNLEDALKYVAESYELSPSGEVAVIYSRILVLSGEKRKAVSILEEQLSRSVYPPLLHFYLKLRNESGETREARNFLSSLRKEAGYKKKQSKAETARWEAELSSLMGDLPSALSAYRISLMYDPDNFEVLNDYGLVLMDMKRWNQADEVFERVQKMRPESLAPLFNRLELSLERRDYSLAEKLVWRLENMRLPPSAQGRLKEISEKIKSQTETGKE